MITIKKVDLKSISWSDVLSIAEAYIKVFSTDKNWSEFWKCPKCGHHFPESFPEKDCSACKIDGYSVPLVEYWTKTEVLQDFYREMGKEGAVCFIAENPENDIVGFCWGYFVEINEILEKHLGANGLADSFRKININNSRFAYQDEIAVLPEYQGSGIAKKLYTARHQHFKSVDPDGVVFFRTLSQPPSITYKWMVEKLGYGIVHTIEDSGRTKVIAAIQVSQV